MRDVAFPDAKSFADLFDSAEPWTGKDEPVHYWEGQAYRAPAKGKKSGRYYNTRIPFSRYCCIDQGESLAVLAKPHVLEAVKARTVFTDERDSMYFRIILRTDGTALVTCDHNLIIGGPWLARIDASTIPFQPTMGDK